MNPLENIKIGDKVYRNIGSKINPRLKVETIEHLTPTQVIADGVKYRRFNGRPVGGGTNWLQGLATPEIIAAYDKQQAKEKADREAREAHHNAHNERRVALARLFPSTMHIGVNDDLEDGKWELTFYGLSDDAIHNIAAQLGFK